MSRPIALIVFLWGLAIPSWFDSTSRADDTDRLNKPVGNSYRTANFVVGASTTAIAERIGQAAERLRQEQAIQWLGRELPSWPEPCLIEIQIGAAKGGYSTFSLDKGKPNQRISAAGSLQEVLADVLPHEMTHVILANFWGNQFPAFPRWADEGAAMLAEGDARRRFYDFRLREVLARSERLISIRELFSMQGYPVDWVAFYSEGNSVTRFLVERGGREKFLQFVKQGFHDGWDQAVQSHYHFRDVEQLEKAWLTSAKPTIQREYTIDLAIKNRLDRGGWKTLGRSCLAAPEGKQAIFSSTTNVARPQSKEVYPAGYIVELTAIAGKGARSIVKVRVEKSEAFELEDGQFEFQRESLVTIDEVALGDLHKITFAQDLRGNDKTIVELAVREVNTNNQLPKAVISQ